MPRPNHKNHPRRQARRNRAAARALVRSNMTKEQRDEKDTQTWAKHGRKTLCP
jgi:hypothetical protein